MNDFNTKTTKVKSIICYIVYILALAGMVAGMAYFTHTVILEQAWNKEYLMFTGILYAAIAICSLLEINRIFRYLRMEFILILGFIVSALLLLLSDFYVNLPFWMIGGVVVSALVNRSIGMMYVYYFVFHAIFLQGEAMNGLIFHFVCATLLCVFVPMMKTWKAMLHLMIASASSVIVLSLVMNRFFVNAGVLLDTFQILCVYLGSIFVTMLLVKLMEAKCPAEVPEEIEEVYNDYNYLEQMASEEHPEAAEFTASEELFSILPAEERNVDSNKITEDFSSYALESRELLQELKQKKKAVYAQAVLVGKVAQRAAQSIDVNADFAKTIGLYQKLSKMTGDSLEEAEQLLRENEYPELLIQAIRQLNGGTPEWKETAIVAMADEIIANYSVIRHVKKMNLPAEKIVDKTLSKKMFQGEMSDAQLSVAEYAKLRNAVADFLTEQDNKAAKRG